MRILVFLFLMIFTMPGEAAVVLMYHRFGEDAFPSTNIRMDQFEAQLQFLEDGGFQIWPLPKLVSALQSDEAIPDKTVVITIDDAYRSVYEKAFPLLKKRAWPFTVFVSTDAVDNELAGFMSWDQLRELHSNGATLANHTARHDYLIRKKAGEGERDWLQRIRDDVNKAQMRLQKEIGPQVNESPRLFAWPYGEYSAAVADLLQEMNYVALGQQSGAIDKHSDLRALPRYPVNERYGDTSDFAVKARSLALPVLDVEPWDPLVAEDLPPVMKVRLAESDANLDQLACYFGGERLEPVWLDKDKRVFEVQATGKLPAGRSRYNCTAPHRAENRYYWFSHIWIH